MIYLHSGDKVTRSLDPLLGLVHYLLELQHSAVCK